MKKNNIKKIALFGFFLITFFSAFFVPAVKAQAITYDGADTVHFPNFSIYPSEVYEMNYTVKIGGSYLVEPEKYYRQEFVHGNDSYQMVGSSISTQWGYGLWGAAYTMNATSDTVISMKLDQQLVFYNDSISFNDTYLYIPVGISGVVTPSIFNWVAGYLNVSYMFGEIYHSINSVHFWNSTYDYAKYNFTSDGILENSVINGSGDTFTLILMSQPAQLPAVLNLATEDGILNISSTNVKLDLNITDADNNNDGVIDTDYLYRTLIDSTWTSWTPISALIDYDLSSIPSGALNITIEVKNMYGITQDQITIQYTAPSTPDAIPGYSTLLIVGLLALGASVIIIRYRKKSKK